MSVFYLNLHSALSQESKGPIFKSLGGSGRAATDPGEVGRTNPAGLVQLEKYYLAFEIQRESFKRYPDQSKYSVTLADGSFGVAFPGSFTYEKSRISDDWGLRADGQLFHLSLASLLSKSLSFGVSLHRFDFRPEGGDSVQDDNVDLGFLWAATPQLAFAVVFEHLLGVQEDLPVGSQVFSKLSLGTQYLMSSLVRMRADYSYRLEENSNHRGRLAYGIESTFRWDFKFRVGHQMDGLLNRSLLTSGIGWEGPRLRFDYSFQSDIRAQGGWGHVLDLWLHF